MLIFLNSIGTGEIFVILLFVLIFFGADSIPGLARNLGRGFRQIKDASQDIQDEITKTSTSMRREMNTNKALFDAQKKIEEPLKDFTKKIEKQGEEIQKNIDTTD